MPSITPIKTDEAASQSKETLRDYKNYTSPLIVVTLLFFMWGFITCMNDILIPKLQEVFTLQLWQAMLIQTAFFGAYFIVSFFYFMLSITKGDPIQKIGYKNGIIIGLIVAALGCVLFYPAAVFHSYGFFLMALFILASGITVLQITANPYVAILGPPETSSSRMNLSQALNSFGTTIAPIIGGYLIFDQVASAEIDTADSVKLPYLGLAALLLLLALLIKVAKLPRLEGSGKIETGAVAVKHPHLVLGIICIFMYVGGEVSIGSALINYIKLPQITGLTESEAKHYLAFYWGGAMIGRFFGAVALSTLKRSGKFMVIALIALVTFLTVYALYDLNEALIILGLIALNVVVLLLARFIPNRTVGLFAMAVIGLLLIGVVAEGTLAMWAIIAIGLFNSIMFPTIFDLAIKGLGRHTSQGSSLLVMAIVGGAIVPPLQGLFADLTGDLQLSFIIPMICYAYIVYYGFVGYKVKEAQV
ncbi:sugar MFS transporter [Pontibacter ramchanderi]|uniref:FHS family L-fucose permease-like MFS transporter n=1 Tax=Pontibacter ramchanderi TaxID=1179743 RepID=A0A2N3V276_9BACT|nr:sugar MFS transporter [Pontibacter ramchanderi]PKV75722.1 FHS family L-fucose permease-like MFS transporter [Pontibacter ramchanderi]